MSAFALIDISISHFTGDNNEVDYYLLSALSHKNPVPGDDSPEDYHGAPDQYEYDDVDEAIEKAVLWGCDLIDNNEADQVTIFLKGNEHKILPE